METPAQRPADAYEPYEALPAYTGRGALRTLWVAAPAVALAAVTYRTFELDRFYSPKELVLHVAAVVAALLALRMLRTLRVTAVDVLLVAYLALNVISAIFATNGWFAVRSVTMTASGILVFWTARALRDAGRTNAVLAAVTVGIVVACITSLLQTYGVNSDIFSINRSPGGTLGNRNSIAHLAAIGLPLLIVLAARTHPLRNVALTMLGMAVLAAPLVLTRSRAGYLGAALALLVTLAAFVIGPAIRRSGAVWLRLAVVLGIAAAGVATALALPNSLRWVGGGDNPYMASVRDVANFQEGSGAGRLVQYRRSLVMAVRNPLVGVGPGNWAVEYPDYAARRDPSLDRSTGGMTANPWPSSDWIALVAERGIPAALLFIGAALAIALSAFRRLLRSVERDDALAAAGVLGLLTATAVVGAFDAVLLLAAPTLLVWAALGALWNPDARLIETSSTARQVAVVCLLLISFVGALRSAAQVTAMAMFENSESTRWLRRAAVIDPANYRLQLRLAARGSGLDRAERCEHALAARALYPHATQALNLASGCD